MSTTTKPTAIAAAQQTLTDAKAALVQLRSERITAESAVAAAASRKLAAKASPTGFRAAASSLADAEADLERVGLLISDAEVTVRGAEESVARATVHADHQAYETLASEVVSLADTFAASLGSHLAVVAKFANSLQRAQVAGDRLGRESSKVGVDLDLKTVGGRLAIASDLMRLTPMTETGPLEIRIAGLRNKAYAEAIADTMRKALDWTASKSKHGAYPHSGQVGDMLRGNGYWVGADSDS